MSGTIKIILWVVVAIIILGGIYYWYTGSRSVPPLPSTGTGQTSGAASPSDVSDAALNQAASVIDSQMSGMTSDTASIDAGLNDQQIPQ